MLAQGCAGGTSKQPRVTGVACSPHRALFSPVANQPVTGERTVGVYPLLKDDICWFFACDFDKQGWALDALAFLNICKSWRDPSPRESP
jgi:hypothetical protein